MRNLLRCGTMRAMLVTPAIQDMLHLLARRRLATLFLLFIAGHRPLLFVAGQSLYLAAPIASLWGSTIWTEWAELLSAPDAPAILVQAMTTNEKSGFSEKRDFWVA
jgi:hypothetical protein